MRMHFFSWIRAFCVALAALILAQAQAATWTGGGTDDKWSNPANWGGTAPVPGTGETLFFDGTTRLTPNNDLAAGASFGGITFNQTAGAFVISGNSIALTGPIAHSLSPAAEMINLAIALPTTPATAMDVGAGAVLTIGGVISGGPLIKTGAGTLVFKGQNTYVGTFNATTGTGTTISAGTLEVGTGSILPTCQLIFNGNTGGSLHVTSDLTNSTQLQARGGGNAAIFDVDAGVTMTMNAALRTDTGAAVQKNGDGTLVFAVANGQLDRDIALNGGTLVLLTPGSGGGVGGGDRITSAAGTTLLLKNDANANYGDASTGANNVQHLTVNGTNAITLNRATAGAGTTHIFNDVTFAGDFTLNINAGSNVTSGVEGMTFNSVTATTVAATLNGNATFDVSNPAAAGTSTLLTLGSTGNTSVSGTGRSLTIQGAGNTAIPGNITTGTGSVIKNGAGKLTLSGTNTYSGVTTINGGTLSFSTSGNLGDASATNTLSVGGGGTLQPSATVDLTATRALAVATGGATLDVPSGTTLTISGALSGSDAITKTSTGTLVLASASNTYSGTAALTAGTATVSGAYPTAGMTVASGTTLNGTGSVGAVTVNGTLSGSLTTGALQVNSNGIAGGALTTGSVDVNSGGTVFPGGNNVVGTMNTGAFNLKAGGIVGFDLNTPASSDLIAVTGNLDLNGGTLNLSNGAITTGTYTLFTYTGTLVHQNLIIGSAPAGYTLALNYGTAGKVQLTASLPNFRTWTALGGANTNWSNVANWDGGTTIPAAGASVMISTAGATVTVDVAVDINTLNITRDTDLTINSSGPGTLGIRAAGMLVSGAAGITLSSPVILEDNQTWSLGSGAITASGIISGNFTLNKGGAGTLTLTANNTYGNTTIGSGTLQIGSGGASGTLGSGNVTNNGTLNINRSGTVTISGVISGSGAVAQLGTGTLRLNGANTYTGPTTILSGLLQLGNNAALGDVAGGTTIFSGAALDLNGFTTGAEPLTIGGTGIANSGVIYNSSATAGGTSGTVGLTADALIVAATGAITLNGAVGGSFALTKNGAAALTLGGANTFTGILTVNGGILKLGNAAALGDVAGPTVMALGAGLDLNGQTIGAETLTVGGTGVANGGAIFNSSANAAAYGGPITLMADTTINSGTNSITINAGIAGGFNLTKDGTGTLALTANSSYTGNTAILAGILKVGSAAITTGPTTTLGAVPGGMVTVSAGGTLDIGGYATANINPLFGAKQFFISGAGAGGVGAIINSGTVSQQNAFQAITLNADATIGGPTRLDLRNGNPVLNLQNFTLTKIAAAQFTLVACTVNGPGNIVVNQGVANVGSLSIETTTTLLNVGSITLNTGANLSFFQLTGNVTTPINVAGSNVVIGPNGNNVSTCASPITLNANVTFGALNAAGTGTLNLTGGISEAGGARSITKNSNGGTDTTALAGANTYTGTTTITAGTLALGNGGTAGNLGTGAVIDNANLSFNRVDAFVVSNVISGTGNVTQTGTGTTSLTAANTYSGTTTVNGGTLEVGNGGTTGALGAGAITTNATLSYNRSDNLNVAVSIAGTGGVAQNGTGTLTLSGASTFSGPVTVNAGAIIVSATGSLAGSGLVNNGKKLVVLGSILGPVTVNGSAAATPATAGSQLRGTGSVGDAQTFDVVANNAVVWPGTALSTPGLGSNETLTCNTCSLTTGGKLAVIVKNQFGPLYNQKLVTIGAVAPTLLLDSTSTLSIAASGTNNTTNSFVIVDTGQIVKGITTSFANINSGALVAGTDFDLIYRDTVGSVDITNPPKGATLMSGATPHPVNQIVVRFKNTNVSPATLNSFTASAEGAGVVLEWNAISEFKNAGFDIYRRNAGHEAWTWINPSLIAGRITDPDPKLYRFADWPAPGVYQYKLESVGIHRADETRLESALVVLDAAACSSGALSSAGLNSQIAALATNANAARAAQMAERFAALNDANAEAIEAAVPMARAKEIDAVPSIEARQTIARAGARSAAPDVSAAMRAFSHARLSQSAAFNAAKVVYDNPGVLLIPQSQMPSGFNIAKIAVQREGRTVTPLALTTDGLLIYAPGYSDEYTNSDALFLRSSASLTAAGKTLHAQGLFASTQEVNVDSPATASVEYHDVYFDYNYRPYTFAPWFSDKYLSSGTTQSFELGTPRVSGGSAILTINVWSLTESEQINPDHKLLVLVNGTPTGLAEWSGGNKMMELSFELDANALQETNLVELVTPAINGVDSQIAFLHSMRVDYTQRLDGNNPLTIVNSGPGAKLYEVSNLSSANAWVVDARYPDRAALAPMEARAQGDGTYRLRFTGNSGGSGTYLVVPAGQENHPLSISKRSIKPLKAGFTYLATGPSQFNSGMQPLLMARSKDGLRAAFADQEQLFDYYGYGRYGPSAIQKAVRATRPQYLLLLGRTTYDYHNYSGLNIDPLCPAFLVPTTFWAQSTSDSQFGDLGRGYPEVAVGRLPVNDPGELRNAVSHILSYGSISSGARVHAAADQADPAAGDFPAQSDSIAQAHPDLSWQRNYLGVTCQSTAEVTAGLTAAANGGADLLFYTGHGNASHLGAAERQILDGTDVAAWHGNAIFLQATCTANWMAKNEEGFKSIAIQALTQPYGGISASIASSTYMNSGMAVEFMNQLLKNAGVPGARWGNGLMRAQQWAFSRPEGGFYLDLGRTEQLFGDPGMRVYSK